MRFCENELAKIDYVNCLLDTRAHRAFERHLETCKKCRQDVESLRLLISGVRQIPRPQPAARLIESTRTRLVQHADQPLHHWLQRSNQHVRGISPWRGILAPLLASAMVSTLLAAFHEYVASSLKKTVEFAVPELLWGHGAGSSTAPLAVPIVTLCLILALLSIPSIVESIRLLSLSRAHMKY